MPIVHQKNSMMIAAGLNWQQLFGTLRVFIHKSLFSKFKKKVTLMKANQVSKMHARYFRDAPEFYHFCRRKVQVKIITGWLCGDKNGRLESGPSPDLKNENLRLFITLMLQQAQEVIVIKSIRDGMSAKEGFHRVISRVKWGASSR